MNVTDRLIGQLTSGERQGALILCGLTALAGAALGLAGRHDVVGWHGLLILLFAGGFGFLLMTRIGLPEPTGDRGTSYYDDPIKVGIALAMAWRPWLPALLPARSMACSKVSVVRTPKLTGTPMSKPAEAMPLAVFEQT